MYYKKDLCCAWESEANMKIKNLSLLLYYVAALSFMEIVFRLTTIRGNLFSGDLVRAVLFACGFAVIFYLLSTIFGPKTNRRLTAVLLGLMATVFASQVIYYDMFTTFYTVYSAVKSPQVLEFWDQIVYALSQNLLPIAPLYLPMALLLALGKRFLSFPKLHWRSRAVLLATVLVFHGSGLAVIHAGGRELSSAYSLYYQRSVPVQSMKRLGLITSMRLDVQRLISHWTPAMTPPPLDDLPTGPPEPPTEPVERNVLEIDFAALKEGTQDDTLKDMHEYFSLLPGTEKNEFTGKYQGYNLIFITAEGFSHLAVREDVTPTLYKLTNEGYHFADFYTPLWGVSTTDGEYVACTGLIPKAGVWSFDESSENFMPFAMGNQLKRLGYQTVAYHNHSYKYYGRQKTHPNMGYEYKGIGNGLEITDAWPRSDLEMMQASIPEYIGDHQFHAYYMTVSGHLNYTFGGNQMAYKNRQHVQDLPLSSSAQAYLATQIEFDRAMEHLLAELEAAGVADNTLIAISADHYPYGLEEEEIEELAGHEIPDKFELYRNSFILWAKDMEPVTITEPVCSLDIIPTISNLLGLEFDSRLLMGRDIHSNADPLVIFADGSFITNRGKFDADSGKFMPAAGDNVDQDYINRISDVVARKFYYSAMILDTDYYAQVLPQR